MAYQQHNDLLTRYFQSYKTSKSDAIPASNSSSRVQSFSAPARKLRLADERHSSQRDTEQGSVSDSSYCQSQESVEGQSSISSRESLVRHDKKGISERLSGVKSSQKHISSLKNVKDNSEHRTVRQLSSLSSISEKSESSTSRRTTSSIARKSSSAIVNKVSSHPLKLSLNILPDELVLKIFSFLTPADLLSLARVNRNWLRLTNDNVLWHSMFLRYAKDGEPKKAPDTTLCRPPLYWKQKCLHRSDNFSKERILRQLTKLHPFTGLPMKTQSLLEKLSMRWVLAFVNAAGEETCVNFHSDCFFFQMALCVRWYHSEINVTGCKRLRFYAARPVFRDSKDKPLDNSPCRRCLLLEVDFPFTKLMSVLKPVVEDKVLSLYDVNNGVIVATWKEGGDLSFVALSLHANQLIQRSILATNDCVYRPPRRAVLRDDVDTEYGLHGFSCTLELRNLRNTLWSQQFNSLFCHRSDIAEGCAQFTLIDPAHSYERSCLNKKISMPWKTMAFTGKLTNACILDCTLLDEHRTPMWCTSLIAAVQKHVKDNLMYEYDSDDVEHLQFIDTEHGRIEAKLLWEDATQQYFIISLQLSLNTAFINTWFSTSY